MIMMRCFVFFVCLFTVACSNRTQPSQAHGTPEPTRDDLRKAMRYHGILFAERDDNGEWFFHRNGKRCPLFAYLPQQKR